MKKSIAYSVLILGCFFMMLCPFKAMAHTDNSEGYSKITMDRENEKLHVDLYIDYFEMGRLIDYGVNPGATPAQLSKALSEKSKALSDYLSAHFEMFYNGEKAEGTIVSTNVEKRVDRDYAKVSLNYPMPSSEASIQIYYNIFFDDNDPMHRNILTYDFGEKNGQFIFQAGERELQIGEESLVNQITRFIKLGFHHIMIGYDHILFVIALVMGTRKLSDVFEIITIFTIAHSITLGLTALKFLQLPAEIIEPLIALSIAYVAVESILGFSSKFRLTVVFIFGLIHGVGFAGALQLNNEITWQTLLSILSFNVGVEVGQALIITFLFPLLLLIRKFKWSFYLQGATTAWILGMGLFWYFERFLG
ncbi:HupE/UreJ family protein [Metabacillus elymi]|uniref:HupE/UreJ family protein n=1 Tax=Metabacillus elymi TaxID=2745198 RepID=A0ABX6S3H3_9BACI|nr:HupE/UreJ family protein [Metabacillus sp. KUDC1714]QNF28649.1 HupE/UreJ family protein [Metabacillus sp. KUDC1714]